MNKLLLSAVSAAISINCGVANADWSIAALGTFGADISAATSINDHGQIVGYVSYQHGASGAAFITDKNGNNQRFIDSQDQQYNYILPQSINNSGQVAGYYRDQDQSQGILGFYTGKNGEGFKSIDMPSLSYANEINDRGEVAVFSSWQAFVLDSSDGTKTNLGSLKGFTTSAQSINNSGQVTGTSEVKSYNPFTLDRAETHAFITDKDGEGMRDIGTLGGENSYGMDINNKGQVVGSSNAKGWVSYNAFVTDENGENMINLGTLGGHTSVARSINDNGEVIGWSFMGDGSLQGAHSFLYSHGGITDLSALDVVINSGWTDIDAMDINNHGQIVGSGTLNGVHRGFLLSYTSDTKFDPKPIFIPSPVPEPSTYAMLLAGLGIIGFMRSKRK
ncbi:MAG: PEP-CTERM sorting domain-containing protein [Nitrosomonas sp.]|nr:PEP-CTERM sorting domain-containing protein [Nitrosomonas sp.]